MLLKRMHVISQLLQNEGNEVSFTDLSETLRNTLDDTSVYIVSKKGKILGYSLVEGFTNTPFDETWLDSGRLPLELNSSLLKIGALSAGKEASEVTGGESAMIVPVIGGGRRIGTVIFVRDGQTYNEDDHIIGEYAGTIIGMVISTALTEEEEVEEEERRMAQSAIRSLSYSEVLAMQRIFDELEGDDGLLVASRIADEAGITRSVIVNALRKLASANVIESRSLGMKGTYLRVLNKEIRTELESMRYPYPGTEVKREA